MFYWPAELLWNGCLTGLIWTPRFRLGTRTPKINSQTFWQKSDFTRDEWNNLLHSCNISHFSSTCCAKNFSLLSCSTLAKRIQERKRRKSCVQVATCSDESIFSHSDKVLFRIKFDCMWKSGDPDSFGETRQQDWKFQLIRRSVDFSSATTGCIHWRVNGKAAEKPVAARRRFRRLRQSWDLVLQQVTARTVAQNSKAWVQPFAHGASSSVDEESKKKTQKRRGDTTSKYRHTHPNTRKPSCPWSGESTEDNLAILWKIGMWTWLFGDKSRMPLFKQQFFSDKTMMRI